MQEACVTGTEVSVNTKVPDNLSEQVPSKVFTLCAPLWYEKLVRKVAFYKFRKPFIYMDQVATHCATVIIAIRKLLQVGILMVGTHVEQRFKPIAWHEVL